MTHVRFWLGLAAPVVLLAAGPALAQQDTPPPAADPSGVNESNHTRELESEIEQYPGPNDGIREDSARPPSIPERMQSAPKKPSATPRPHAATPASPTRDRASAASSIDPSEVQRVFGSDARVIALGSLDAASITRLQVRLHELGHYKGNIDGVMGPQTRAALESYARAQFALKQRLLKQDQLTTDLAEQLGVQGGSGQGSPSTSGDTGPSMNDGSPLLPPGGAPPPSMAPLPTPKSSPSGTAPKSGAPQRMAPNDGPAPKGNGITPTTPATPPSP
jgi:hypothetical protein